MPGIRRSLKWCAVVILGVLGAVATPASAQTTTFTYQGVLESGGSPLNGTVDLRFRLYATASGGIFPVASTAINAVTVVDGLLKVDLTFNATAFNGNDRWLEIDVASPAGGGVGPFTTLTPRQQIMPTPYAAFALNAMLPATYSGAVNFSNAANAFSGSGAAITSLNASNLASGNVSAARLSSSGNWALTGDLNVDSGTLFINPTTNRVGVNTNSPTTELGVRGTLTVEDTSGTPAFELRGGDGGATYSVFSLRHNGTERVRFDTSSLGGVLADFKQVNGATGVRVNGAGRVHLIDSVHGLTMELDASESTGEGAGILMLGTTTASAIRLRAEETAAGNNGSVIELDAEDGAETIELDSGTGAGFAAVSIDGSLTANSKSAIVTIDGEKKLFFCTEAPEMLFEDHGSGQLINGRAEIVLDRQFLQTVIINEQYPMRVMITLTDDCRGVFVKKFGDRFVVQELMGGTSNATFDYKVICNRAGYEHLRLPPFRKQGLFETVNEPAEAAVAASSDKPSGS